MFSVSRRKFIKHTIPAMVVPFCPLNLSCGSAPVSSGKAYLRAVRKILTSILKNEAAALRDASNLFADTIISKNQCFLSTGLPAQLGYFNENTPGLPRIFINLRSIAMAETLRKKDALLTTEIGEFTEIARQHGARIAGITSPLCVDEYSTSLHSSFIDTRRMSDIASICIRSHLPHRDGVVERSGYPFPVLPGSGLVRTVLVTALAGETYRRSGGIGLTGKTPPKDALGFIEAVIERSGRLSEQYETVHQAGTMIAGKILRGGRFLVYDSRDALKIEFSGTSGVPIFAKSITRENILDGALKDGDVLLFGSLNSNAIADLNLIRKVKSATGADAVVSLCPHDETGGYRLFKESSIGLDNLSPEKDGIMTFDSGSKRFLHTGGIMNIMLLWMLIGEITDMLASQGESPQYLMGAHLSGSEQHNIKARSIAEKRGF